MTPSEAILEFGQPLLRLLEAGAVRAAWRSALEIVITTWNALVLDEIQGGNGNLEEVQRMLSTLPPPSAAVFTAGVEALAERKRTLFPGARWMVGAWEVLGTKDERRLRVEVHAGPTPRDL